MHLNLSVPRLLPRSTLRVSHVRGQVLHTHVLGLSKGSCHPRRRTTFSLLHSNLLSKVDGHGDAPGLSMCSSRVI